MSFDLREYARCRRNRVRNLHDGHPVPPARAPKQGRRGPQAFLGEGMDAIVGRSGYVTIEGDRLGWYIGEIQKPAKRVKIVRDAGGIVTQRGDRDAAGHAPLTALEQLLSAIGAYRTVSDQVREARANAAAERFKRLGRLRRPGETRTAG